jgi:hypothetical protein
MVHHIVDFRRISTDGSRSSITVRGWLSKLPPWTWRKPLMKTPIASAAVLICVLTACGGGGETTAEQTSSTTSTTTSEAASGTETTTAEAAAGETTAEPDYTTLLMAAEDLDAPVTFIADPPQANGDGVPGVTQTFRMEGNGAVIVDTLIVCDDPAQAEAVLAETVRTLGQSVVGEPQPWPLAPGGTIVTGTTLDGSTAITAVLFTEDNVLTTLEFNSMPGDLEPAPADFVDSTGQLQIDAIREGLPELQG